MKSLLIVEDEKMIRQGIVTMAKRSPVSIEEIIECRNGEEALEILRARQIDVMFTDIRMPKMDGITLIGHLKELAEPPRTIVVSGYDDFGYAVEALRGGVQDYILKPVEREKVYELLAKLDEQIRKEQEEKEASQAISRQQLRYVLINDRLPEGELLELEQQFEIDWDYRMICCSCRQMLPREDSRFIQITEVEEQSVFLVRVQETEDFLREKLEEYRSGISRPHQGIRQLKEAYGEAMQARARAFAAGEAEVYWERLDLEGAQQIPEEFAGQFVQLFGTDKVSNGMNQLENYYFRARHGEIDTAQLIRVTAGILDQVLATYKNVLAMDMSGYTRLHQPLSYNEAKEFLGDFRNWVTQMQEIISTEFSDYRNKEKINMAVAYIRENYDKELNMAVVSNHISMNYSLFSLSFKQYTGMNFVNYLKMIRIGEAKRLLEETDEKIIDISRRVGYENEKHFMKTFKNICGVSPSEYRKNMQLNKYGGVHS